jgi:hypothetical protein
MTLKENQLFSSVAGRGAEIRLFPRQLGGLKVGTIAQQSGAPTLLKGLALAYNTSTSLWTVYTQPSDAAEYTLTRDAGQGDGGLFTLAIDGVIVTMDWDEDTAGVLANINAVLAGAGKDYVVTVANSGSGTDLGTSGNIQTVTFAEAAGAPVVIYDGSQLTDGGVVEADGIALAAVDAGTALNGTNKIRGILYTMEGVVTSASEEVQATIMVNGEAHRDDLNTATLRALMGGSPSEAEVDTALRADLRAINLDIRGLTLVS